MLLVGEKVISLREEGPSAAFTRQSSLCGELCSEV